MAIEDKKKRAITQTRNQDNESFSPRNGRFRARSDESLDEEVSNSHL
jgi:hypothetical protein